MTQKHGNKRIQEIPWGVIFILLIFFCYVGIPLMLIKLHRDKENMLSNAKKTAAVGWVICALGFIYFIMGITGGIKTNDGSSIVGSSIVLVTICFCGGYAIVRNAKKYEDRKSVV